MRKLMRSLLSKGSGNFHASEIEKNLREANEFDEPTRNACARDLFLTYCLLETHRQNPDREKKLKEILRYHTALRHKALRDGAGSRGDPLWNVASCMETVIQLELLGNVEQAKEVKNALSAFVKENLSPSEMLEIRNLTVEQSA